ncbi:PREDICTED: synaptopodin-2 [Miniopterus natalensis]|uniref:synaptopodin-2 n=1 Tax=Miniopterus natalensis TaxID=291302 RepID=UPI0007A712EA|nr:PREDICTED: synaptopodin-2 [Miniopterus natalensis]
MGTGDFICISMTGGAPWGFRLQGGKEQKRPLQVAKIRSQSKASGSGLREGDEVVSINGNPCADLTYPEVITLMGSIADALHMLVKRPSSGVSETLVSETENKTHEHLPPEGYVESTTLQIRPAAQSQEGEPRLTLITSGAPLAEDQGSGPDFSGNKKEETGLSYPEAPHMPDPTRGHSAEEVVLREKADSGWPGPVVELQLSLSQDMHTGTGSPTVALLGTEKSKCPDPDPNSHHGGTVHINSVPTSEKGDPSLQSSKIIQICSGQELRVIQGPAAGPAGLPRVEVVLDCSDRQQAGGCRPRAGGVDSRLEGGQSEAPPSLVAFAVSSEGTEQGEDPSSERDHSRPHKHRLPGMQGRGAQLFAKRQSRMEKYVVDADSVQARAARAQSPTPSLPAGWKYSPNVRAPPPVAYNPILSPSYPLAAVKSQPPAAQASKASKKGKKPLNALDVMKHQPYQLNASLFTFQPPDAKAGLPQRPSAKPAFFAEAASPVSASPVPTGVPSSPKQESASASYFVAPRPKFSAKKSGVTAQESGRSLSLPGRPLPPTISAASPWEYQPAYSYPTQATDGLERANKRLTPWEAAARSPLGLVDDAFKPRNMQESVVANVVSAARRKVLPGPPEDWNDQVPCAPRAPKAGAGSFGRREYSGAPLPIHGVPTPSQCGPQSPFAYYRQPSREDSEIMSLETRSDYCLAAAGCSYNPQPRGWRRQT